MTNKEEVITRLQQWRKIINIFSSENIIFDEKNVSDEHILQ